MRRQHKPVVNPAGVLSLNVTQALPRAEEDPASHLPAQNGGSAQAPRAGQAPSMTYTPPPRAQEPFQCHHALLAPLVPCSGGGRCTLSVSLSNYAHLCFFVGPHHRYAFPRSSLGRRWGGLCLGQEPAAQTLGALDVM